MQKIELTVTGCDPDFETARKISRGIAEQDEQESVLIAWNDRFRDKHSPACLQCEIKGAPGWEVYGANHGGRLRISINHDDYVFIYS
jgi:hypothetical protein